MSKYRKRNNDKEKGKRREGGEAHNVVLVAEENQNGTTKRGQEEGERKIVFRYNISYCATSRDAGWAPRGGGFLSLAGMLIDQ